MVLAFHQKPIATSEIDGNSIKTNPCASASAINRASHVEYCRTPRASRPMRTTYSCKNHLEFGGKLTLAQALSHRTGEGESCSFVRSVQPLWKLRSVSLVPSPVGRERVRVRDVS